MQFPKKSEAFAATDIKEVIKRGNEVYTYSFLKKDKAHDKLITDRELNDVKIANTGLLKYLGAIFKTLMNPVKTFALLHFIIKNKDKRIKQNLISLALVPIAIDIYKRSLKDNLDVLHLFWGHYSILVAFLVKKYNPKITVTSFLGAYDLELQYQPAVHYTKYLDAVFTHSDSNIKMLSEVYKIDSKDITVSYRGIDTSKFNLNANRTKNSFLYAGRLIRSKGTQELLVTFKDILAKFPNATLTICGDGEELTNMKNYCKENNMKDNVIFKGHISQHELFQLYFENEYFLFLSTKSSERLPNVIKEAMYSGMICISKYTQGMEELIHNHENGYIIEKEIEITPIITHLNNTTTEVKILRNNGKKHISNSFSVDRSIDRYINGWKKKTRV